MTTPSTGPATAVLVTARNAMQVTGMSWERCVKIARQHGIAILRPTERGTCIVVADFIAVLRGLDLPAPKPNPLDDIILAVREGSR